MVGLMPGVPGSWSFHWWQSRKHWNCCKKKRKWRRVIQVSCLFVWFEKTLTHSLCNFTRCFTVVIMYLAMIEALAQSITGMEDSYLMRIGFKRWGIWSGTGEQVDVEQRTWKDNGNIWTSAAGIWWGGACGGSRCLIWKNTHWESGVYTPKFVPPCHCHAWTLQSAQEAPSGSDILKKLNGEG